jgi:hypothetical protein
LKWRGKLAKRGEARKRGLTAHMTVKSEPRVIDWASPVQEEVFNYGAGPMCASGGFGSAKTWALCLKALWLSSTFPKNRGLIGRKVWDELRRTTMSTFFKICPDEAYRESGKRVDSEKYLQLNNGSEILWAHLDDPETENVIRGLEINWFLLDQAEEIDEEIFDLLCSRLGRWDQTEVPRETIVQPHRCLDPECADSDTEHYHEGTEAGWQWKNPATGKALPPTFAMLACNPDTETHWIYRRFHPDSPEYQEKYSKLGYRMFFMDSRDNKFLPKQNLDVMMQKDESFIRRFVRGEWGIPEGQIHTVPKESIVEGNPELLEYFRQCCTLHRTLDHGDAAPTVCLWWAVDRDGNCFCYREYYHANRLVSEHRREIAALSEGEHYQFQLADPSIFFKTQQRYGGMWSTADEYSDVTNHPRQTAIFWSPGDNNELGTRNRISEYLRVEPKRIHPITKEMGSPKLFFIKRSPSCPQGCYHAIIETRSQRHEKIGTDSGRPIFGDERDKKIIDHAYDAVRYFVASRPSAPFEMPAHVSNKSFAGVRRNTIRFKQQGGFAMLAERARRDRRFASA